MTLLCCLALAVTLPSVPPQPISAFEALYGDAETRAISGNGTLSMGMADGGWIADAVWQHDQLTSAPNNIQDARYGLHWAVRIGDTSYFLADCDTITPVKSQAMLVSAEMQPEDKTFTATSSVFVLPKQNVAVMTLVLTNVVGTPRVFWYGGFAPCTRNTGTLPLGDSMMDYANGFAAFADRTSERLYHFRPENAGARDWQKAETLVAESVTASEWASFDKGVYIGGATPNPWQAVQCGDALDGIELGDLTQCDSVAGRSEAALELIPFGETTWVCSIVLAFGSDLAQVNATLDQAVQIGTDTLRDQTQTYWTQRLGEKYIPALGDLNDVCLTNLLVASNPGGAVVRAPVAHPPLARVWLRDTPYMVAALPSIQSNEATARYLTTLAASMRENHSSAPRGSFPMALYPDGDEAAPVFMLDVQGGAQYLWALADFVDTLPTEEKTSMVEVLAPTIERAGDFLLYWTTPRTGFPAPSYDAERCRDTTSPEILLASCAGLDAAHHLMTIVGKDKPEWRRTRDMWKQRLVEMDNLSPVLLISPLGEKVFEKEKRFEAALKARQMLPGMQGSEAAYTFWALARMWKDDALLSAPLRAGIHPIAEVTLRDETGALRPPDSVSTALLYAGAHILSP